MGTEPEARSAAEPNSAYRRLPSASEVTLVPLVDDMSRYVSISIARAALRTYLS